MGKTRKAFLIVPFFVCSLVGVTLGVGYLIMSIFKIPSVFGFTFPFRVFGLLVFLFGTIIIGWTFKYRRPKDFIVSTYITLLTAKGNKPLKASPLRTEPFVIQGPYKYVRNPMYLGIILWWLGLWLVLDYTSLLISAVVSFLIFYFIAIPLEERELKATFGTQYEEYAKRVRRIIPYIL